MWMILPALALTSLILFFRSKHPSLGWRAVSLMAATVLSACSVLFLEIMSVFSALNPVTARLFWGVAAGVCISMFLRTMWRRRLVWPALPALGKAEWFVLGSIAVILAINAFVAFVSAPNNYDSQTYHLPRVMHWAVNGSIFFYPTDIPRQVFTNPGAEYALLHIFFLTGNDRWFNLLQWASFAGCILSVSLIARLLGAARPGQIFGAFFAATVPMAILQSTSTQNDLTLGFWCAVFIAFGLMLQKRYSRSVFFAASAALGLAVLIKGTFFILFPFVLWFAVALFRRVRWYLLVACLLVLFMAGGHYYRCWVARDGASVIDQEQSVVLMQRHEPAVIMLNGLTQLASELTVTFSPVVNALENGVRRVAAWTGVDLHDPGLFTGIFGITGGRYCFHEDYAPNPLHVLFIILLPFFLWKIRPGRSVWIYYGCLAAAAFLFLCVVRWQPWITRLHLPLIILAAPLVGLVLALSRKLIILVLIGFLISASATIIFHQTRTLTGPVAVGRVDRKFHYFIAQPGSFVSYATAASGILASRCDKVGLIEGDNSWEYPLWVLTGYGKVEFRKVTSDSDAPLPCLIITINSPRESVVVRNGVFVKVWEGPPLQVLARHR